MGKKVNVVVIAVVKEKIKEDEEFSHFLKRMRSKYADILETQRVTFQIVK